MANWPFSFRPLPGRFHAGGTWPIVRYHNAHRVAAGVWNGFQALTGDMYVDDYCDVCRNWCSCGWISRIREDERSNA